MTDGWQPIATKPKDGWGGPFLVYGSTQATEVTAEVGFYGLGWHEPNERDGGWTFRTNFEFRVTPTHWQPLPEAPALNPPGKDAP